MIGASEYWIARLQDEVGILHRLDASVGASGPHDFAVRNNIVRQRAV
jgi:hypothetical protein